MTTPDQVVELLRRRPARAVMGLGALGFAGLMALGSGARTPGAQGSTMLLRVLSPDPAERTAACSALVGRALLEPIRLTEAPHESAEAFEARMRVELLSASDRLRLTYHDDDVARAQRVLSALVERYATSARDRVTMDTARARGLEHERALSARLADLDSLTVAIPEGPGVRALRERRAQAREACAALEGTETTPSDEVSAAAADVARLEARVRACEGVALRRHPEVVAVHAELEASRATLASAQRTEEEARAARLAQAREALAALERELEDEVRAGEARAEADRERRRVERQVLSQEREALVADLATRDLALAALGPRPELERVEGPDAVAGPSSPRASEGRGALSIALAAGVLGCLGLPLLGRLRGRGPSRVRSRQAGARVLGRIPDLEAEGDPLLRRVLEGTDPASSFGELVGALDDRNRVDGGRSLLITSARPGDGKSLVAVGLATALARGGRRVLLIDANASRPRLHRLFGLDRSTGVATALALNAPDLVEQLVRPSHLVPGLHALSAGLAPDRSPPAGSALKRLIGWCVDRYDWVILDGPAVTGAEHLAAAAMATIVVVPSAAADMRAETARGCLADADVVMTGVVLNDGARGRTVQARTLATGGDPGERKVDQTDQWPLARPRLLDAQPHAPGGVVAWLWSESLSPVPLGPGRIQIGRDAGGDVVLPVNGVSRVHASIALEQRELVLQDEGSRNGSFVNGRRVERAVLRVGDRIGIGACEFEVRPPDRPARADRVTGPIQRPAPPCAMSGSIHETPLVEVLHGLEFHRKTGVLAVHNEPGPGVLVVRDGRPIAARMGELIGETAVLAMLRVRSGRFTFTSDPAAEGKPMQATLMSLMLEASRRSDDDGLAAA